MHSSRPRASLPPPNAEVLDSIGNFATPTPLDAMRGTVIAATRAWFRTKRRDDDYLAALTPATRAIIVESVASDWIALEHALDHYRACDALAFTYEDREDVGACVSRAINGVVLTTLGRLAGSLGASALTPLRKTAQLFGRSFRGGAVRILKISDTEARFEVAGSRLAGSQLHRDSIGGALRDGLLPFERGVQIVEAIEARSSTTYAMRIRW